MFIKRPSVLLIYTGGTIGMKKDPATGALEAFNFDHLVSNVPELNQYHTFINSYQFDPPIDSSDMTPELWAKIVKIINYNYAEYDGFVILHGTDTMAYTASALSFMLENLNKPVILTGSQLPIGQLRTDGKENLITSIEIAAAKRKDGSAMVPEVCIYFDERLLRGNRTTKMTAEGFNAFYSYNYSDLARAGIDIHYDRDRIRKPNNKALIPHYVYDSHVIVMSLFPGFQEDVARHLFNTPGLRAIVMRTFGSGNAPTKSWLIECIKEATAKGIIIVNISQCMAGSVQMGRYDTGLQLLEAGVVSGHDSTVESAVTKLMFLLGHYSDPDKVREEMNKNLRGEITI
jgi:L-asparaginase